MPSPVVLYKAIYESIAYEFAAMTRLLSHLGEYEAVHISGGGSKSDFTLRLRASISGKKSAAHRPPIRSARARPCWPAWPRACTVTVTTR